MLSTPVNNLFTEFLPDVASHVHIRIIFVYRILKQRRRRQQRHDPPLKKGAKIAPHPPPLIAIQCRFSPFDNTSFDMALWLRTLKR
jgi:hypothetical protein